jgi:hypothetical protein
MSNNSEQPVPRSREEILEFHVCSRHGKQAGDILAAMSEYASQCTEGLEAEIKSILKSVSIGSERYAHLKFDDEPFTPYQIALQKIEGLEKENERLRFIIKEQFISWLKEAGVSNLSLLDEGWEKFSKNNKL